LEFNYDEGDMKEWKSLLLEAFFHALMKQMERSGSVNLGSILEEVRGDAAVYLNSLGICATPEEKDYIMVCCHCKRVRDSGGSWHSFDDFLAERAKVEVSHGLCSECAQGLFPESSAA